MQIIFRDNRILTQLFIKPMMIKNDSSSPLAALTLELSQRYGEVIGGNTLKRALGFSTMAAFKQSINRGTLTLPTFYIEGRRGRYALASDVAEWLMECRANAGKPCNLDIPESFKRNKSK